MIQLDDIMNVAKDIAKGQIHDRYGEVYGAIRTIRQSYLEEDVQNQRQLQNSSQATLNKSIEVLKKEIEDGLSYFTKRENRSLFNNDYSLSNINKKLQKLTEDYFYFQGAKSALIELKEKQGMNRNILFEMTKDLDILDSQMTEADILSWFPPKSEKNAWQNDLLHHLDFKQARIVIEYEVDKLLENESDSNG